jgi:parallel beta-helix repeat protein
MKRALSTFMFVLLLVSTLAVAFNIQPVKAEGTVYIRVDGSIDPPTAPISTLDNVTYTLTDNINDSIVVERDNIVVDGAGYTVQGTGAYDSKGISLSGRSNVTTKNANIKNFYYGIGLDSSSGNSVSGNNITNNDDGIRLDGSSNSSVSGNNITANRGYGIWLNSSSGCSISGNNITNNYYGIRLDGSSNSSVSGNNITANNKGPGQNTGVGIWLRSSSNSNSISGNNITANNWEGIRLYESSSNSISGNNIANNRCGIYLYGSSNYNSISGNNITNKDYGIRLDGSSINLIYHNNFIDNTKQVSSYGSVNFWGVGYPMGGNYWSDYTGVDLYSGPYQNETGSDGMGDTPYIIDAGNQDNYPLMNPYVVPTPSVVTATVDIRPDPLNLRGRGEWVTAYIELPEGYDVNDINVSSIMLNGAVPVDLDAPIPIGDYDNDTVPDLMVKFNKTAVSQLILSQGIMTGNVTLTITGQLHNGTLFEGSAVIEVRMPGDVNMDGKVDITDLIKAANAFGSYPGHPRWDPVTDENEDGRINILDLIAMGRNFGKTYP